jgi:signal transduction histidine kinase
MDPGPAKVHVKDDPMPLRPAPSLPAASPAQEAVTPTRAFLVVSASVLAGELLSVWFGESMVNRLGYLHELMDALFILVLTYPALHYFFVLPMRQALREKALAQESWRRLCDELETKVRERTARLEDINASLRQSGDELRQLSARLLTVQEEDRKRVARELHDSIGQSLTAVKFMIERALRGACACPEGRHMEILKSVIPVIQQSVEESRRICMALRPSMLDDLGLLPTLDWFVREFRKTYPHIPVSLDLGIEERQIPDVLKINIFRIAQEALNNAAKHARPSHIQVSLQWREGALGLTVADDGIGLEPAAARDPARPGGFGLSSMRERAELHDGTLVVHSAPGLGTTVSARWPLVDAPDFVDRFYADASR